MLDLELFLTVCHYDSLYVKQIPKLVHDCQVDVLIIGLDRASLDFECILELLIARFRVVRKEPINTDKWVALNRLSTDEFLLVRFAVLPKLALAAIKLLIICAH